MSPEEIKDALQKTIKNKQPNYKEPDLSKNTVENNINLANDDYKSRIQLRDRVIKWILIFGGAGFIIMSVLLFYLVHKCANNGISTEELEILANLFKWYVSGTLIEIFSSISYTVKQVFTLPKK